MFMLSINDSQSYVFSQESGLELETESINSKGEFQSRSKIIANFLPEVNACIEVNESGIINLFTEVTLTFMDYTKRESLNLPLKGLEKVDWSGDIDLRCILNPDNSKSNEHIANLIRLLARDAPVKKKTVLKRLGTHVIDGVPMFNAGDRLIGPSNLEEIPEVILEPSKYRLVIDPACSEQEAVAGILRVIDLSYEAGRIVFTFNVLNLLREAFIKAGKEPRNSLFLYGRTGNKKTTISGFQTQIFNRDKPLEALPRLDASVPAAVKLLYEKDDCVVVLDDLFPAQDSALHKKQEATLLEITRVIGDGIEPARMRGYKVAKAPPRCGVLFTGEYCIGTGSDAARLLPIEMATPIDNYKLTACQNEPLILSTFYSYFLEWYITNFDIFAACLKNGFQHIEMLNQMSTLGCKNLNSALKRHISCFSNTDLKRALSPKKQC